MTRPLRDRLGEMMREARIGKTRYAWSRLDDSAQEEWRRSADHLQRLAADMGVSITLTGDQKPKPTPPAAAVIYSLHDARDSQNERAIRCEGDGRWSVITTNRLTKATKILLTFSVEEVDRDCDQILGGDPKAKEITGALTKVAAVNFIRMLHAESMETA
ncbi:hypothetical protein [Mesorhizobium sp. ANAO-SY3R2]|uniref:hypothetical protein n=1 Tax=Mesorhizobium sp. ANAO-SY3R2 TaxID=3166644 RepID=UPI00366EF40B